MSTFIKCVVDNLPEKLKTDKYVKRLKKKYDKHYEVYRKNYGEVQAQTKATVDVLNNELSEITRRRVNQQRAAMIQQDIVRRVNERVARDTGGIKPDTPSNIKKLAKARARAYREITEYTAQDGYALYANMVNKLHDFVNKYNPKLAGWRPQSAGVTDFVREMLGEASGNADASAFAKAARESMEIAENMYRLHGGKFNKLENYFPQRLNRDKFVDQRGNPRFGFDEFDAKMQNSVDLRKMKDFETGEPMTPEKLREINEKVYNSILTNGNSDLEELVAQGQRFYGGKALENKWGARRFYKYKNADAWIDVNRTFGVGDNGVYDLFMNHLQSDARDVAVLKNYGPQFNGLRNFIEMDLQAKGSNQAQRQLTLGAFDMSSGIADSMVTDPHVLTNAIASYATWLRSVMLGSAVVSAISDAVFVAHTARMAGMSGTRVLKTFAKDLFKSGKKQTAANVAFTAERVMGATLADARFSSENLGGKVSSTMLQTTIEGSGLGKWTRTMKNAIALESMQFASNLSDTTWDEMPANFRGVLEDARFTADDWDTIRKIKTPPVDDRGATLLTPMHVMETGNQELALKYTNFLSTIRNQAVNEPTTTVRAITSGAAISGGELSRKGTASRTFFNSFFALKTFPLTVLQRHIRPMARQGQYKELASLITQTTLLGGLALHAKDFVWAREPRDTMNADFLRAALMQGGGLGIFGDFLFADESRFGNSLIATMAGPVASSFESVVDKTKGNLDKLVNGQETTFGRDLTSLLQSHTPGQFWYNKLAMDRILFDSLEKQVNADFDMQASRRERKRKRDYGQESWWREGELLPEALQ